MPNRRNEHPETLAVYIRGVYTRTMTTTANISSTADLIWAWMKDTKAPLVLEGGITVQHTAEVTRRGKLVCHEMYWTLRANGSASLSISRANRMVERIVALLVEDADDLIAELRNKAVKP